MVVIVCGGSVHAYVYGTILHSTMRMQNAATGSERECSCMIACTDKSLAEINLLACKPAKLEQYMLYCAYYIVCILAGKRRRRRWLVYGGSSKWQAGRQARRWRRQQRHRDEQFRHKA